MDTRYRRVENASATVAFANFDKGRSRCRGRGAWDKAISVASKTRSVVVACKIVSKRRCCKLRLWLLLFLIWVWLPVPPWTRALLSMRSAWRRCQSVNSASAFIGSNSSFRSFRFRRAWRWASFRSSSYLHGENRILHSPTSLVVRTL